ncbi:recombinase family protein [Streptomyces smyrnaeus]|uniref:Recombinase family protein n=1 Tax=Streptomyces smyrnaeus TaxID=1387713 RepID=A0ABS3Y5X2_9ACTN|nr:recombinase family protein [Streptomyces smyrnaeus]MBO8203036.1 recombinase family protein [Streptomyces smyrnaeus]
MERQDLPALRALGFKDDELKRLGLWAPAIGDPATLAEMYVRRSKKKDTLSALRAQVRQMCAQADRDETKIRHVWFEQKSASKAYVRREEFDNSTAAIVAGLSKTLYVFKTSRLSRRGMGQVGLLLDTFEERQSRIYVVAEHLDSRHSRMILAFLSEQARDQAKDIAEFTKLGIDAHKAEGRWPGGVTPYGLECPKGTGKLRHLPAEYPTARRIAEQLLKGIVPAKIADKLNSEGKRTRNGAMWRAQTIIHLARSVSWAGLIPNRERATDENGNAIDKYFRNSEPLCDVKGNPIECGQGVVTYDEFLKINALISGRSRAASGSAIGNKRRGIRQPVTILTDLFKCPHCKGPMGNGGRNYNCRNRANMGESVCQGAATMRQRADDAMTEMWAEHITALSPESSTIQQIARRWLQYKDPTKEAKKRKASAALESAVGREMKLQKEFFVLQKMSEENFETLREQIAAQIAELKAELDELSKEADLTPLMDAEALMAIWNSEGIEGRRALMQAAVKRVTITPAKGKGDRAPIKERLQVEWRDEKDPRAVAAIGAGVEFVEISRQRRKAAEATA